VDKARTELEAVSAKIQETTAALDEAEKGREDTVSPQPTFSVDHSRNLPPKAY
jgi:hypothetical protein